MKKTIQIKVDATHDYGIFNRLEGNRDVECVKKIIKSIKQVGYIPNPIMINEKMEVIDGQNRLAAAEQLNLPIYYYIVEGTDIDTARALNLGRTNWKPIDYAKSYAEEGIKSYQLLLKLLNDNAELTNSIQEVYGILSGKIITNGCAISKDITDGSFRTNKKEYERAQEIMDCMADISGILHEKGIRGSRRTIVTGIAWCMRIEQCDRNKFISCIQKEYPRIRPVVDGKEGAELFLQDLTKLYNEKLKRTPSKKINFDVIFRDL